ncbi:MAG: energy transducer TonB [Hylemonella sp.]|nr:energy transducer TonB [Hylemonella sp.]MDP1938922.1 energy transducer TonB [Hylemonella sp.]
MNRRLVIAASVVLFHIAALWALQSGLLQRAVEVIVPAEVLSEFISPPAPKSEQLQPPAPKPAVPQPQKRQSLPAPLPVATPAPAPAPAAPAGVSTPQPPAPAMAAAVSTAPPGPPAPPRLELPSSDAAYLNNPKPPYPVLSKRMGEQGKVVVRVLIGTDGTAQQAEIRTSSGYDRLDQAALSTVLKWRYVPGKRGGVPEAMWFNVPINFVLE